jgi:hypothetical protein
MAYNTIKLVKKLGFTSSGNGWNIAQL